MNIIKVPVSKKLSYNINKMFNYNKQFLNNNNKINYINIYHKMWPENKNNIYKYLIEMLKSESPVFCNTLMSHDVHYFGFIQSLPNCDNQHFHIDYFGKSITFFIPLTDITNMNGTEYLHFNNNLNYKKYFSKMLELSNKYTNKNDIINKLNDINLVYKKDYDFRIVNCEKYSLIEMQNYVFHRGKTNETNETRAMFQITLTQKDCKLNIMDHMVIEDAELDDENKDLIIKNRTL